MLRQKKNQAEGKNTAMAGLEGWGVEVSDHSRNAWLSNAAPVASKWQLNP